MKKFFIIFSLISIIPIFVVTSFTYERYTSLIQSETDNMADSVFNKASDSANTAINDINQITEMFTLYSGSDISIIDDLKKYKDKGSKYTNYDIYKSNEKIKFVCQSLIYSKNYINGIFLFTPSGVTLGYGYGTGIDVRSEYTPFSDEWYQSTVNLHGKTYVDGITTKNFLLGAKPSISFSKALYDIYTHQFLGVLFIDCSPSVFDLSKVNTMPDTATLFIENNSTGYMLYSNVSDVQASKLNNDSNVKIMKKNLSIGNLTLVSAINYGKLYHEFDYTRTLILYFGVICAVVFIIISVFLSHYLTKPITHLSDKVSNWNGHNLVTNEHYLKRTDEIGALCNEYNNMINELNYHIKHEYQNKLIVLDSQMKSLEAQINSHFLYNTLESINSIAEIEEVDSIATMSLALGNMFRYSIKTKSELVTIADELNHVNDYISIQRIRFDNRFELITDIPDEMRSLRVLKLILQPVVENALYHGLQHCNYGHTIELKGYTKGSIIYLEVLDDGVGIPEDRLQVLNVSLNQQPHFKELGQRDKQSIGLKNIHSRIELYYGKGYGLSVESKENTGTKVRIRLPIVIESSNETERHSIIE
jgi:Putative regulator of cell autolysis